VNSTHVRELLERAAASVTPTETDPTSRLLSLGRRSVQRRRAWGTAGSVAAAVAAVVAVPLAMAPPDRSPDAGASGTTVSFGDLSVAVPKGWRTSRLTTFDPCSAEPHTVYLAERWDSMRPRYPEPRDSLGKCESDGQAWMALVLTGPGQPLNPERLVVKDNQPLEAKPFNLRTAFGLRTTSIWTYRAFTREQATTAAVSGDEKGREQLLQRVTWPAGPPAPPSGGLALPDRITSAVSEAPNMVEAMDAQTLTRIRTTLAELRDRVPAGEECTLQRSHAVGIAIDDVTVVLGDATCSQAVSTHGGRVWVPAGLGKELLDLIEASDRAAAERKHGTRD
jgi:hypothetical protein